MPFMPPESPERQLYRAAKRLRIDIGNLIDCIGDVEFLTAAAAAAPADTHVRQALANYQARFTHIVDCVHMRAARLIECATNVAAADAVAARAAAQ